MSRNRIRDQYKNVAVLLRRIEHVSTDYDVFVVCEESVEQARYRAAMNARKFIPATEEAMASWQDWLDPNKTKAVVLGYNNKPISIYYKGYLDLENQPKPQILKNLEAKENDEE